MVQPKMQPKVHQPSMKVFTVGLDDKERAKQNEEKSEMTKIPIDSNTTTPAISPAPPLPPRQNKKFKGCGIFSWLVAAFLVILLCITISEISYNRSRDEAFFRLKWAELRQRMLGYELLSRIQNNNNQLPLVEPVQPPPVVDERLAFSNRKIESLEDAPVIDKHVDEKINKDDDKKNQQAPDDSQEEDARFGFLRAVLDKIRGQAENSDTPMRIHVIQVKPLMNNEDRHGMSQQAWDDGFGEVAMPKQNFGPFAQQQNDMPDEGFQGNWNNRPFESREDFFEPPRFMFNDAPFVPQEFQQRPLPFSPMQSPPFPFNPWNNNRFPINNQPQFEFQNRADMPAPFPFQQQQQPANFFNQQPQMPVQPAPVQQQEQQQRPWYLPQEEQANNWQNTWQTQNNQWQPKQDDHPFNPHPAAAAVQHPMQFVDGSNQVKEEQNEGIANFEREESFNIPMDVIHDAEPVEIEKNANKKQEFVPNQWQHSQPEEAIQQQSADAPAETDAKPEPEFSEELPERHQFLPVRPNEQHDVVAEPSADGIPDMKNSPFFQIDDPNSFKH